MRFKKIAALAVIGSILLPMASEARMIGTNPTGSSADIVCWGGRQNAATTIGTTEICVDSSGNIIPTTTNVNSLGTSSLKFSTVYATNSSAVTALASQMIIGAPYTSLTTAPPPNGLVVQGKVGIGTSTPINALDVVGGVAIGSGAGEGGSVIPSNNLIVSGQVGIGTQVTPTGAALLVSGHIEVASSGVLGPIVSNCGTGTVVTGVDNAFRVSVAGGAAASAGCTVAFRTAFNVAPFCVFSGNMSWPVTATILASAITLGTQVFGGNRFDAICIGSR